MLGKEKTGKDNPPIDKTYPPFDKCPNRVELHQRNDKPHDDTTPNESFGETLKANRRDTTLIGKKPN